MMLPSQQSLVMPFETLQAMRRQEWTTYAKPALLDDNQQLHSNSEQDCVNRNTIDVDTCRAKMCEWSLQIVDFCQFRRETVVISMSYLDRFLVTPAGANALKDCTVYQLAAMTCLYTAIKVHEPQALSPQIVSELSRGAHTAQEVQDMEVTILAALQWRMNPPTSMSFVREFVATMLPSFHLSEVTINTLMELASGQTERAVVRFDCVSAPASTIAYVSFINALRATHAVDKEAIHGIGKVLAQILNLDTASQQVDAVMSFLHPICNEAALALCATSPQPPQAHFTQRPKAQQSTAAATKAACNDDAIESPRGVKP